MAKGPILPSLSSTNFQNSAGVVMLGARSVGGCRGQPGSGGPQGSGGSRTDRRLSATRRSRGGMGRSRPSPDRSSLLRWVQGSLERPSLVQQGRVRGVLHGPRFVLVGVGFG